MQNRMTAVVVGVFTFAGVWMMESHVGLQIWLLGLLCYVLLIVAVKIDTRNLVSLTMLRMFPMLVFAVYVGVVFMSVHLLEAHMPMLMAIYLALLNVAVADYLGQLTVGAELVALMGRDHLGRPGRKLRREATYY